MVCINLARFPLSCLYYTRDTKSTRSVIQASQAALADLATLRAQVSQLIRNLEQPFFEATRKTVVIIALDKAMTSQNVNFASPHAASQMINNIENKVAGKLTAFTDDVNDTVSDLAAGRCTVIAALRVLGAIQAELQEMNQAIEVNRATVSGPPSKD